VKTNYFKRLIAKWGISRQQTSFEKLPLAWRLAFEQALCLVRIFSARGEIVGGEEKNYLTDAPCILSCGSQ
jgi:hypothetical protein